MKVRELMTAYPYSVPPDGTLQDALELMLGHEVRQLPVVEDNAVVGMVTDRDVRVALGVHARSLDLASLEGDALTDPVSRWMSYGAATIGPDEEMAVACRVISALRIGALPVVDDEDEIVGILSVTDILEESAEMFEGLAED